MTWPETYNKYKDSELMKEFNIWVMGFSHKTFQHYDIKRIWGELICFAEMKGWCIEMMVNYDFHWTIIGYKSDRSLENRFFNEKTLDNSEQAMLWCADKFFKVA